MFAIVQLVLDLRDGEYAVVEAKSSPRALKARTHFNDSAARLKSGPSQDPRESHFFRKLLEP